MAESKFAGLFQRPSEPAAPVSGRVEHPAPAKPIGRPRGKRSDPEWKQFSVLLRRRHQRKAADILRDRDDPLDLSGLLDALLAEWIERQGKA